MSTARTPFSEPTVLEALFAIQDSIERLSVLLIEAFVEKKIIKNKYVNKAPAVWSELEINMRAYNAFKKSGKIKDTDPPKKILEIDRPHNLKGFGLSTFVNVLEVLSGIGTTEEEIISSKFYKTVPEVWRLSLIRKRTVSE